MLILLALLVSLSARAGFVPRAGLWFNPDRDGHGLDIEFSADSMTLAWYSYRPDGSPIWYLAAAPLVGHDWQANLDEFRWDGQKATPQSVGSVRLHFIDQESVRFDYTLGTISGSESMVFLRFAADTPPQVDTTGLWFDPSQSGWGLSLAGQNNTVVAVSYFYDDQGLPSWSIASGTPGLGSPLLSQALTTTGLCPGCTGTPHRNIEDAGTVTLGMRTDGRLDLEMDIGFSNTVWQRSGTVLSSLTVPVPDQPPRLPPLLLQSQVIDGEVNFSRFSETHSATYNWNDLKKSSAASNLRWATLQSDSELYLAVEWEDPTEDGSFDVASSSFLDFDGIQLVVDSNGDGVLEDGEDARFLLGVEQGSSFLDQHVSGDDRPSDGVSDGLARLAYHPDNHTYQAEFLLPLANDINGEDGLAGNFNILLHDRFNPATLSGRFADLFGADPTNWPELAQPTGSGAASDHPQLPTDIPGTIVFLSDENGPQGEIYRFIPATGVVEKRSDMPGLFKDTISLSHDRNRVAFTGSTDSNDLSTYDVYVLDLNTQVLTRLTNDSFINGHPAWSPDDQQIVYASFRDGDAPSLIVMDVQGNELIDLTPAGASDNDPDFLPDGRIVFKTDRFNAKPNIDIAIINPDGTGLIRVSNKSNYADHDPVANAGFVVYERFILGTDFSVDPRALFHPWYVVQSRVDGSEERMLMQDAFVNWLPVFSPDGQFVVFQKTRGFTDLRLMTRAGRRMGRFIPNHSQIRYTDWK